MFIETYRMEHFYTILGVNNNFDNSIHLFFILSDFSNGFLFYSP